MKKQEFENWKSGKGIMRILGMQRATGLLLLLLTLSVSAADQPNVVLINIDNHSKWSLGFYGNKFIETPNIDRLFEEGIRFDQYHTSGRCTSSRSALLTGRYHARNGALGTGGAWGQCVEGVTTLGHVFSENGYQTAMFGKWHMGETYPLRPGDRGFEEVVFVENGSGLPKVIAKPGYNSSSRTGKAYRFNHNGVWKLYDGFRTDTWLNEIDRYLTKTRDESKPFFMYFATVTAHGPHFGPEDLRDYYKAKYQSPQWDGLRDDFAKSPKMKDFIAGKLVSQPYDHAADIASLDRNVGRLLQTLKQEGLMDNTIIVYMSDGAGGGPATLRSADRSAQFGPSSCPMTVRLPNAKDKWGTARSELVANIDFVPTLAELCGFKLKKDYAESIDGKSFASLLDVSGATPWGKRVYIDDHQSRNKENDIYKLMLIEPLNSTTVILPDGEAVTWKSGETSSKAGQKVIDSAKAAYDDWLKRIVSEMPLGAFGKSGADTPPVYLEAYPIVSGPAGDGMLNYFLLEIATDGTYILDPNNSDQHGLERTERSVISTGISISRQSKSGHVPVGFDEKLNGYRVLPETFVDYFTTSQQEVRLPQGVELKKGRYLLHLNSEKLVKAQILRVQFVGE